MSTVQEMLDIVNECARAKGYGVDYVIQGVVYVDNETVPTVFKIVDVYPDAPRTVMTCSSVNEAIENLCDILNKLGRK